MNYINRCRTKKKEPYTIYNSDNTINLVPLFDEYIDNTAINKLQTVINSFLSYNQCPIQIKNYLLENMKNINKIADFENYFAFALVWCVFELTSMKKNTTRRQAMLMGLILMLLSALLLLISKTAILYIACFAVYRVWMSTARIRQMAMRVLLFVVCIGSIGLITTQIPNIRNRIVETFRDSSQLNKDVPLANSTGSRLAAWHNEWTLIKENWLTGYGTGEANMALKHKLINDGYVRLAEENMHTHNQVFHTWLDLGIVGVLLMVAILLVSSQVFSRLHNRLAWWLLPLIVMNILTDDMLEVQAGTVFFAFFLTLFIYQRNNERLSYS